jgi:hypothetical protein
MHPSLEHSGNSQRIRFLFLKRTLDWKLQHTPESPAEAVAARRVKFQRVWSNSGSAAGEIRSPRRLKQLLQVTLQLSV